MWFVWLIACAGHKEPAPPALPEPMPEPMPEEEPVEDDDVVVIPLPPQEGLEDLPPGAIRRVAVAKLEPRSGSTATGTIMLVETVMPPPSPMEQQGAPPTTPRGDVVKVTIDVQDAPPGSHGVHVHENGDCSAPDASSAGGHFNPEGMPHGDLGGARHPGDFGNLEVGADGRGHRELAIDTLTLGPGGLSVIGRAVVVHERPDDFSQPNGNAGRRIACGVVLTQVAWSDAGGPDVGSSDHD